jgi:small subunit ribosomal protein S8
VLKYDENGHSVINELKKISKPGRRVYQGADDIRFFKNGYGTLVVSTNKGVLANDEAFKLKVGGEVICSIW